MLLQNKIFKGTTWVLFLFVFTYLVLRVFLNETLHDEIATYMFYIYHGDFYGDTIVWDANNHLLNSLICRWIYVLFGDNFVFFRLPNLIAFVFYFLAVRKLVKDFTTPYLNTLALVGLNTIPFILEYFAYTRGYGLSLAFIMWAFIYTIKYTESCSWKHLLLIYLLLTLAISANLTLINTSLLLGLYLGLITFFRKPFILKSLIPHVCLSVLFLLCLLPFIRFSFQLRIGGALYYGSDAGLWDVTGRTLTKYTFFIEKGWILFVYLAIFAVIVIYLIKRLKKGFIHSFLIEKSTFYAYLFFGNIIGILALAFILNVNYPEDRTAMYLIPLFLLLIAEIIDRSPKLAYFKWSFLFFPISFVPHLSLHTSVFSPDDRMTSEFYNAVKNEIKPEHSIMIYPIMGWNWHYMESHQKEKASIANLHNPNTVYVDILLTKNTFLKNKKILDYYELFKEDAPSHYMAFKRKVPLLKAKILESSPVSSTTSDEYIDIYKSDSLPYVKEGALQITVEGKVKTFKKENKLQLVVSTETPEGERINYIYFPFEFVYQGKMVNDRFLHHFIIDEMPKNEAILSVYLWNRSRDRVELKEGKCYIYEVKNP